jgi:hypothetical protein
MALQFKWRGIICGNGMWTRRLLGWRFSMRSSAADGCLSVMVHLPFKAFYAITNKPSVHCRYFQLAWVLF